MSTAASVHYRKLSTHQAFGCTFSAGKLHEAQPPQLLESLGIPPVGLHAMRHGASSSWLADAVTLPVVQKQMRHSDPRITLERYSHVIGDAQRIEVQKREQRLVN